MSAVVIAPEAARLLRRHRIGGKHLQWRPGDPAAILAVAAVAECEAVLERGPAAVLLIAAPGDRPPPGLGAARVPHQVVFLPLSAREVQRRTAWLSRLWEAGPRQAAAQERRLHRLAVAGRLAATAVHEVGNALAYTSTSADYLARSLEARKRRSPELAAAARQVRAGVGRALEISRLVLELARESAPRVGPVDVNGLLERVVGMSRAHAPPRVRFHLQLGQVPAALGECAALAQVLTNLLLNAVDAAGPDGAIRVSTGAATGKVVISVADSGPGIAPEMEAVLFQPFATSKPGGTGLGLSLSRDLVRSLGGTIEAGKGPLGGAELRITLRAAPRRERRARRAPR